MVGITEIGAALAGINSAIAIGKAIRQADGAMETAELKLQLADIMTNLADAKLALAEMGDAISTKDAEIERLRDAFAFKGDVIEVNHFFYKQNEDGKPTGRPFCPNCLEAKGRWIMTQNLPIGKGPGLRCPNCSVTYDATYYYEQ